MAIKQLPADDDQQQELPPPDPNNPARRKALAAELGGTDGVTPLPGADSATQPQEVTPLPAVPVGSGPAPVAAGSAPDWHADPTNDPFASMGGGTYANGGWLPKGYPTGGGAGAVAPADPQVSAAPAGDTWGADPFASMGGGVQIAGGGWVPRDHPGAVNAVAGGAAASSGAPQYGTGAAAPVTSGGNANPGTVQGAYQNALQNLLTGKTPQEAGLDAANSPAVQAYQRNRLHQEGIDRALLAERNAVNGTSGSGGAETGVLGLRQAASRDIGQYAGQQAQVAEAGRRQELLAALQTAQSTGDTQLSLALQRELANLKHQEFGDELNFNIADRQQYYNQMALEALLGGASGPGTGQ